MPVRDYNTFANPRLNSLFNDIQHDLIHINIRDNAATLANKQLKMEIQIEALEAENEKLKEENKEVMEENEKLRVDLNEYCSVKTLAASVVFWKEENDKLTEENEKLKEGWKVLNDFFTTEDFDGQAIVSYVSPFMMMEDEIEKLKEENEKLKAENDWASKQTQKKINKAVASNGAVAKLHGDIGSLIDKVKTLEKQNEELKEFRKNQGIDQELLGSLEAENYTLKAETDRLGKWKIYYEDLVGFGRIEKYEEKRKEYDPDFVPHSD